MRELRIETVGVQGDGVAREGGEGRPIFAPLTLPGERVLARVAGDRAEVVEILQASEERTSPPCPHFGACGGCALQHWRTAPYLAWKRDRISLALARVGLETAIDPVFAASAGGRRRLTLHAVRRDGVVRLGFKARRSWRLVSIETCVIARPELTAALPALRALAEPFFEHPASAPSLHATWTETGLDVEVSGVEARSGGLSADARAGAAQLAAGFDLARLTLGGDVLYQARAAVVRFGRASVNLPPGAFLQASTEAERAMAEFITVATRGAERVIDLFCGVGTFSFRLAERSEVEAFDVSGSAVAALMTARGSVSGLRSISGEARDLDRRPLSPRELRRADVVVFDPPRAGAAAQAGALAASGVRGIIAVSCNPATFARDARVLADGGYRLARVLPVDQFLWSPHIELVAMFFRDKPGG
ncbi:MAG: class I SAM-dependent RNA methyltransferase [Caulobacteraceae bacterium]